MAPTGCPAKGNTSRLRGTRQGRGKRRYKFQSDAVQILKQYFERNPYPDYTTREEMARAIGCPLHTLENWFQNKRARLLPEEKQRLLTNRRRCDFPAQEYPPVGFQDTQMPANTSGQASYVQGTLPHFSGPSAMEILAVSWEAELHDSMTEATDRSPSSASDYGANAGSSPNSAPEMLLQPSFFGQYCAQGPAEMGESGPDMYGVCDFSSKQGEVAVSACGPSL